VSEAALAATISCCEYLWKRYGRFPVHMPAFKTVLGFQAAHIDVEFYDKFYKSEALTETIRADFARQTD